MRLLQIFRSFEHKSTHHKIRVQASGIIMRKAADSHQPCELEILAIFQNMANKITGLIQSHTMLFYKCMNVTRIVHTLAIHMHVSIRKLFS